MLFQKPGPGIEIKAGRDVRIRLSKGTRTLLMPDLTRLSLRHARLAIQENGLCAGHVSFTHLPGNPDRDAIVSQTPGPGQWVQRESCVDLLVSLGPLRNAYKMDDLRGLSLDEAVSIIEKGSLVVGNIKYAYDAGKPEHTIIDHNPKYGYRVVARNAVDLVVNRNPSHAGTTAGPNQALQSVFSYRLEPGFFKKRVQVHLDTGNMVGEIYDNLLSPGSEFWLVVPRHTRATLHCYVDGELVQSLVYAPN